MDPVKKYTGENFSCLVKKYFLNHRKKKRIFAANFTRYFGNKVYIFFAPGSKKRATTTIPYIYIKEGRFRCGHLNVMPEGTRKKPRVFLPGLREKFFCLGDADNAWGAKVFFFSFSLRFGTVENGERILEKKWRKKKVFGTENSTARSIKQILGVLHDESVLFLLSQLKWVQGLLFFLQIWCLFFISN